MKNLSLTAKLFCLLLFLVTFNLQAQDFTLCTSELIFNSDTTRSSFGVQFRAIVNPKDMILTILEDEHIKTYRITNILPLRNETVVMFGESYAVVRKDSFEMVYTFKTRQGLKTRRNIYSN